MKQITCVVLLYLFSSVCALCPYECECTNEPNECPPGISLVIDGCNCCKVCARQDGQQCNENEHVCDLHRGLFCDFSKGRFGDWGVCAARSGRPCYYGDVRIISGEMVEPSCKKKCWCLDGSTGCIPNCPHEIHRPRSDLCPNARLESVPGECCDQWVCDTPTGDIRVLPLDNFWNKYVREEEQTSVSVSISEIGNRVTDSGVLVENEWGDVAEAFDQQINHGRYDDTTDDYLWLSNFIPGDEEAVRRHSKDMQDRRARCDIKSTPWSSCSKSCGLGLSTRVTNDNPKCILVRQSRLCELRPCNNNLFAPKRTRNQQQCQRQKRARKKVVVTYAGCESVKKIRPRYCGGCSDSNRCCTPKVTRNSRLQFRCDDGQYFTKTIMTIRSCQCNKNCANVSLRPVLENAASYSLFNDMHRSGGT